MNDIKIGNPKKRIQYFRQIWKPNRNGILEDTFWGHRRLSKNIYALERAYGQWPLEPI